MHVGLGLDFVFDSAELEHHFAAMVESFPPELGYRGARRMVAPEDLARLVAILLERGYTTEALRAILGGNWMRIARQIWRGSGRP
jgi:membrane dipeptidase